MNIIFDFETYYGPKYSLTSLSYTDYIDHELFKVHGVAVKEAHKPAFWLEPEEFPQYVQSHLQDTFIAHNAQFDFTIWTRHYQLPLPARCVDTKALAAVVRGFSAPGLSLNELTGLKGHDLKLTYGKRELESEIKEKLVRYALNDAEITEGLLIGLVEQGLADGIDVKKELQAIDATLRLLQPKYPLCVDRERLRVEEQNERKQEYEALSGLASAMSLPIRELEKQVKSRPQFTALLQRFGVVVPLKKSPRTGEMIPAIAKNDEEFLKLKEQYEGTIVGDLIQLRLNLSSSLKRTRTARLQRLAQGDEETNIAPIQVHLNYAGAQQTLRWSGSNSLNLQNLPRGDGLRACLVPPPGHRLVVCDYSSIEARVLSWLAQDERSLEDFRAGKDVYVEMAESIWSGTRGMNPKSAEFTRRRFTSKCLILGLGYRAGWLVLENILRNGVLSGGKLKITFTEEDADALMVERGRFADTLDWFLGHMPADKAQYLTKTLEERPALYWHYAVCWHLVQVYRASHPEIQSLWSRFDTPADGEWGMLRYGWCEDDWVIRLPGGTRLLYNTPSSAERGWSYHLKKGRVFTHGGKIVENVTQSVARNLLRDAWVEARRQGLNVVLTVHDEIVCVEKEGDAEQAAEKLTKIMSTAPEWAPGLPVAAEAKVCGSYAEK